MTLTNGYCFFLEGISETAAQSKTTLQNILALKGDFEKRVITLGRKADNANKTLYILYSHPIITVKSLQEQLGLQYAACNNLVNALTKLNILKEVTGYNRNRLFVMHQYLDLFNNEHR